MFSCVFVCIWGGGRSYNGMRDKTFSSIFLPASNPLDCDGRVSYPAPGEGCFAVIDDPLVRTLPRCLLCRVPRERGHGEHDLLYRSPG